MQKQDYAGLSRTFGMYYPDVKRLVEETEQFYNSNDTDPERWRLTDYDNVRLIGTFAINKNDYDVTLPRLYFKKEAEMTNPAFYVVTRPSLQALQDTQERIIHIGTSVEAAAPYACSVSALTGGILPHTEKNRAFSTYLKIMSYVKKYGYCTVYELQTGYDDIRIKGINGTTFAKEAFSKQIFNFVNCDSTGKRFNDDFFLSQEEKAQKDMQNSRNNNIWDAVTSFKAMVNTKPEILDAMAKLGEPVLRKYKDDRQEITVTQEGPQDITLTFKRAVELMTARDYEEYRFSQIEKVVTPSAKILCQTGDTVYDQYASYIARKVNNEAGGENTGRTQDKQMALSDFERTFAEMSGPNAWINYRNIFLGNLEHDKGIKCCSSMFDGKNSSIVVDFGKKPSFTEVKTLVYAVETLFDLDPNETKVTFAF